MKPGCLKGFYPVSLIVAVLLMCTWGYIYAEYKFDELSNLAKKYGTDKRPGMHNYTEIYEYFFYPIKAQARNVCEIGIAQGASLKMFKDYFPNATIYGIDIRNCSRFNSKTVKTFIADQVNRQQLQKFLDAAHCEFDVILDDGGHSMEQQQVSFGYLFKAVKPGGYYIIEDAHTSLAKPGPRYGVEESGENTTLHMIYNFLRNRQMKSKYLTPEEEKYLTDTIKYCNLFATGKNKTFSLACIFKKKETAP